jgi:uncharacterized membrane protein required for colicin V production
MFGFNWVDLIIVAVLIVAMIEGARIGALSQLLVIASFFASLFALGWFFPHIIRFHNQTVRTVINGSLVFLGAGGVCGVWQRD